MIDMSELGNFMCPDWNDFPIGVIYATGGLLGTSPIICGGYSYSIAGPTDECYIINSTKVELVGKMSTKRASAASVTINDKSLWIIGGTDGSDNFLSSSEFVNVGGAIIPGPELQNPLAAHAMINVKKDLTMVIGGFSPDIGEVAQTFYYNHANKVWSNGPNMNQKRQNHAVGIVTDEVTKEKHVIVTGGTYYYNGLIHLKSTEFLLDATWVIGENIHSEKLHYKCKYSNTS